MRHCVLIMNPNSGKKKNINRNSLYDILRKYGYDAEIRYTKRQLDATSIVHDLPDDVVFGDEIAIDTEALGLNNFRDRLCLVQITDGSGVIHMVHFSPNSYNAPNLIKLLTDDSKLKIMHFARFDVAILQKTFSFLSSNLSIF